MNEIMVTEELLKMYCETFVCFGFFGGMMLGMIISHFFDNLIPYLVEKIINKKADKKGAETK